MALAAPLHLRPDNQPLLTRSLPLNVVPLRPVVRDGAETILRLDSWLVVIHRDGQFHLENCPCCQSEEDPYLAEAA